MKGFLAAAAVLAGVANASPVAQGASSGSACANSYPGTFTVNNVLAPASKRSVEEKRQQQTLTLTLSNGILKDQAGRIGYIAANRQFQFDNPIQAGAVITSGWQACQNGHLSLGGKDVFYQCLSGNFYNLYDTTQGGQCQAIYFSIATIGASSSAAAPAASSKVSQISDGQPQATSAKVSQISDGQPQATSAAKVTQISDGQVQATSAAKVTQISDGQVQATSAASGKVTQISDGQVQATSAAKTTASASGKVTQISDGQVQATSAASGKVTQISDGQVQATSARPAPATFTGGAARELSGSFAFVAGLVGAVALL